MHGRSTPAGDEQARAAAEELAKRLAVAWWSAEGMTKGHPEANNALWFCTEHVEMWWSKATEQQPFFLAMATVLLPVMAVRVADAVAQAVKAKDDAMAQVTDERDEMARLNEGQRLRIAELAQAVKERAFPVIVPPVYQGEKAHPLHIPWSLAERAYSVYAAKHGKSQSLERLAERGGFHASELDEYVPGWREEVNLVAQQAEEIARLERLVFEHSAWEALEYQRVQAAVTAERERTRLLRETVAELVTRGEHLAEEHMVAEDDPHAGSHIRAFNDALDNVAAALRAPGPFVNTMLGQPITAAERDRISKDGP